MCPQAHFAIIADSKIEMRMDSSNRSPDMYQFGVNAKDRKEESHDGAQLIGRTQIQP
jgi:hypothetical protein